MKIQICSPAVQSTPSKPRILKNVTVICVGVMFLFIAYDCLTTLQSTMNSEQGIGVISQAVLYLCFCASSLVLPKYVIRRLGSKLTFALSMLTYIPYVAANFYPHWSVMIPTSVLIGLGAPLLWGAQANYLTDVSFLYADLVLSEDKKNGETQKAVVVPVDGCHGVSYVSVDRTDCGGATLKHPWRSMDARPVPSEGAVASEFNESRYGLLNIDVSILNADLLLVEGKRNGDGEIQKAVVGGCQGVSNVSDARPDYGSETLKQLWIGTYARSALAASELNVSEDGHPSVILKIGKDDSDIVEGKREEMTNSGRRESCACDFCQDSAGVPDRFQGQKKGVDAISVPSHREGKDSKGKDDSEIEKMTLDFTEEVNGQSSNDRHMVSDVDSLQKSIPPDSDRLRSAKGSPPDNHLGHPNPSLIPDKDSERKDERSSSPSVNRHRARVVDSTTASFFGVHGLAFLSSAIWGNLLSFFVLRADDQHQHANSSSCGAAFCGSAYGAETNLSEAPSEETRFVLTGVCVCLGLASFVIVLLFLDPLEKDKGEDRGLSLRLLTATFRLFAGSTELVLLVPLSLYIGMVQGFYTADFTRSYVGCALGTHNVGLVSVVFGVACAISSLLSGWLVKQVGRGLIFAAAALLNASSCVLLLEWSPDPDSPALFFVAAGMWGGYVGTVWSQLRAFYGVLFKADEEAAFASFHVWYSLGFCLTFGYSNYLCTGVKLCVLLAISTLGYAGYFAVEWRHSRNKLK